MAVRTREDLLSAIRDRFSDDTSDETLGLLEDITDTLDDFETRSSDSTDWKTKYEQNDADWRKKYRDRFFNPSKKDDDSEGDEGDDKPIRTFEDLFK